MVGRIVPPFGRACKAMVVVGAVSRNRTSGQRVIAFLCLPRGSWPCTSGAKRGSWGRELGGWLADCFCSRRLCDRPQGVNSLVIRLLRASRSVDTCCRTARSNADAASAPTVRWQGNTQHRSRLPTAGFVPFVESPADIASDKTCQAAGLV